MDLKVHMCFMLIVLGTIAVQGRPGEPGRRFKEPAKRQGEFFAVTFLGGLWF